MKEGKVKIELDRISYSEGVKVSIGDYENRDVHISLSTSIREGEEVWDAVARASKQVKECLFKAERRIRKSARANVDFETMDRLKYFDSKKSKVKV